jgi:hypothetical protein
MKYYSAIKNNKMSFGGKWMELAIIMLRSKISQALVAHAYNPSYLGG